MGKFRDSLRLLDHRLRSFDERFVEVAPDFSPGYNVFGGGTELPQTQVLPQL